MKYRSAGKIAANTGFSRSMIIKLVEEGSVPCIRRRNRIFIDEDKIEGYLNKLEVSSITRVDDLQRFVRDKNKRYSL
jgi:hypothetical protein